MPALTDSVVLARVRSELAQVPTPSILLKLRDVLSDFYDRSKLDRVTLDPIDTIANTSTYPIVFPVGKFFVQAHNVRVNNIELEEKSEDDLDLKWQDLARGYSFSYQRDYAFGGLDDPSWRTATATQPRFYYFEPDGAIRLVAIPETVYTADRGIIIRVSLKPNRDTVSTIDDLHWQDNADVIIAGTLARLFVSPNKPWTDLKQAAFWGAQYENGVTELAGQVARSDIRNDRQVYHVQTYA